MDVKATADKLLKGDISGVVDEVNLPLSVH